MRNLGDTARIAEDVRYSELTAGPAFAGHGRGTGLRGIFALGFLFVTAAAGYGLIFLLIDKWYKGGSLGIL